jgi:predicted DNA-binding protein
MPTAPIPIRLSTDLKDRLDRYANSRGQTSTQVVRELLGALRRGEATIRSSGRKDAVLSMRIDRETLDWLDKTAQSLHTGTSDVIRGSIEALLDDTISTSTSLNPNPFPKDNQP